MLGKQKKGRPYINLAVFSFAAAGVMSMVHKIKKMMKEKCSHMKEMFKGE